MDAMGFAVMFLHGVIHVDLCHLNVRNFTSSERSETIHNNLGAAPVSSSSGKMRFKRIQYMYIIISGGHSYWEGAISK